MCPFSAVRCRLMFTAIVLFLTIVTAFNLDTSSPYVKNGQNGTYFGFSVAHSRWDGVAANLANRIIVGAPKANGKGIGMAGHWETGAIFGCSWNVNSCVELSYRESQHADKRENRTGMWLGVSVAASRGTTGPILACGHRYQLITQSSGAISIFGICYKYSKDFDETEVIDPCPEKDTDKEDTNFGWCQAGTSTDIQDQESLVGLPGSQSWSGSIKWVDDAAGYNAFMPEQPLSKNTYLGSSVVLGGNLLGSNRPIAVTGAPKAGDVGQVLLFDRSKLVTRQDSGTIMLTLSGDQFGGAFGHAVAVVDVKRDGAPSLVVSAPYYRGRNVGGAIYVYDNAGTGIRNDTFRKIVSRTMTDRECSDLHCEDAAFGYSVASVGDINGDNYNDLAVGAPYEGNGAVYIFLGSNKGISSVYSQRISADDFSGPPQGFGVSLAGFSFPDNKEGYDGIVIGAYKSDQVYVVRSRPIVRIEASVRAAVTDIDPSVPTCSGRPGVFMPCAQFSVCFNLTSNRQLGNVAVAYKLTGDAGEARPERRRVQLNESKDTSEIASQTRAVVGGKEVCVGHWGFIRDVRDLLKPITITVDFDITATRPQPSAAGASLLSYPIADVTAPRSAKLDFNFKKTCVTSSCSTNVSLSLDFSNSLIVPDDNTSLTTFVFNSGEVDYVPLTIAVTVDNAATTSSAYEPVVYVDIPQQLLYDSYTSDVQAVSCSANATRVACVLPKIMIKGITVKLSIRMKVVNLGSVPSTIVASVNVSNPDTSPADNVKSISIRQVIKTDLALFGQAEGGQVFYNGSIKGAKAMQYVNEIGDLVQHTYTIVNSGPGDVERVTLVAEWPYETIKGGYLLYMERNPELRSSDGSGSTVPCRFDASKVNPEGYLARPPGNPSSVGGASGTPTTVLPRVRRAASEGPAAAAAKDTGSRQPKREVTLDCRRGTAKCFNITCEINFFKKKTSYILTLPARMWGSTLWDEGYQHNVDVVHIISRASLYIDPALNVEQAENNDAAFVSTDAQPSIGPPVVEQVAWWIIAVAGGAGLLLLVIIIIIFWKCGFFQRHRPMLHEGKVEKKKSDQPDYKYEAVATSDQVQ